MIRYSLHCHKDHEFEVWFRSSSDYDDQKRQRTIICPACGSSEIEKSIMAPNVSTRKERSPEGMPVNDESTGNRQSHDETASADGPAAALSNPAPIVEIVREYHNFVKSNADDVGDKFAEEARKIHFEEAPARGIYGKATAEEVRELYEDEIDIAPLPPLPEDHN